MPFPPLTALRAFEAAARLGSFKSAAQELCVTQSAVSHQIRHLEEWLGAPLFSRRGGRPSLLPHGAELARALAHGFEGIAAACDKARSGGASAPVVVAAIPSVAVCWLIPRLPQFHAAHPGSPLRIIYALHGQRIDFSGVNLAFAFAQQPPNLPGVRAEPFLSGLSAPVCSPALARDIGAPVTARDLFRAGLLHDSDRSDWGVWMARAGLAETEVPDGPVFEDFNLLRAAALSGQGLALCPLAMIRDDLVEGRLVQVSDVTVLEDHAYYLLSAPATDRHQAKTADAFRAWALGARESL